MHEDPLRQVIFVHLFKVTVLNFPCHYNESRVKTRALERTGFLETLRYDATTTTAVLSSIAHSTMSELEPNLESDRVVYKINVSQIF